MSTVLVRKVGTKLTSLAWRYFGLPLLNPSDVGGIRLALEKPGQGDTRRHVPVFGV